jgi:hypothetical protein
MLTCEAYAQVMAHVEHPPEEELEESEIGAGPDLGALSAEEPEEAATGNK